VYHAGSLATARPAGARADSWTYDPLDNRRGDAEPVDNPSYLTNQTGVINLLGQGVVYQSDALADATEVTGFPKVTVWLSMDVPDTDLGVALYEVLADGTAIQLSTTAMRARYRESLRTPTPVPAGKPTKYVFDDFTFFSRQLAKGSRVRLVVQSLNSVALEKNYNSGGVVAQETGKDARTAHIQLLHDAEHASTVELPTVK
jgi:putative CocE/NonD family hydrolase